MYSTYVVGFGIGWCLAYVIVLIILNKKIAQPAAGEGRGPNDDHLKELLNKLTELKAQFSEVRFDELEKRELAYSRNPKGFNYDFQGFFGDIDERVKGLDGDFDRNLKKCSDLLDELSRKKRVEDTKEKQTAAKNPFAVVNWIGLIGILIVNFIYLTKIF